jgi:HSP20 family protein
MRIEKMKNEVTVFDRKIALNDIQRQMERLLDSRLADLPAGFDFSPRADLQDNGSEYILSIEIPGIKKEDVIVEISGNELTVRGERHAEKSEQKGKRFFTESSYGSFFRNITMPEIIDEK